jgi:hypothetical protein
MENTVFNVFKEETEERVVFINKKNNLNFLWKK